jgi:hypothetical protein
VNAGRDAVRDRHHHVARAGFGVNDFVFLF